MYPVSHLPPSPFFTSYSGFRNSASIATTTTRDIVYPYSLLFSLFLLPLFERLHIFLPFSKPVVGNRESSERSAVVIERPRDKGQAQEKDGMDAWLMVKNVVGEGAVVHLLHVRATPTMLGSMTTCCTKNNYVKFYENRQIRGQTQLLSSLCF